MMYSRSCRFMSSALCTPVSSMRSQSDGGLFQLGHAQQVAGLDDDLERVGEVVREAADFERELFGNLGSAGGSGFFAVSVMGPFGMQARRDVGAESQFAQCTAALRELTARRPVWKTRDSRQLRACARVAVSRNGGIGRRAWFRSTFSQGSGGSSPLFGTNIQAKSYKAQ